MKKCEAMLIILLYTCATMHAATTKKRSPSQRESLQEYDRKVRSQAEQDASKPFWQQVKSYNKADEDRKKQTQILNTMLELLQQQPNILSYCKKTLNLTTQKYHSKLVGCCPLEIAAVLARDSKENDPERIFFEAVAYLDLDSQWREKIICLGIRWKSPYIVQQMLQVGTDVTCAPQIIKTLVSTCESIRNKYLTTAKEHDGMIDSQTNDVHALHEKAIELNRLSHSACNLSNITYLLLGADADLSYVVQNINRPHFKQDTCWGCYTIAQRAIKLLPQPSAPPASSNDDDEQPGSTVYTQPSSSSSLSPSFSSSSQASVPRTEPLKKIERL